MKTITPDHLKKKNSVSWNHKRLSIKYFEIIYLYKRNKVSNREK